MSRKRVNFGCYYGGVRETEWKAFAAIAAKTKALHYILLNEARVESYKITDTEIKDLFSVAALALQLINSRMKNYDIHFCTQAKDRVTN